MNDQNRFDPNDENATAINMGGERVIIQVLRAEDFLPPPPPDSEAMTLEQFCDFLNTPPLPKPLKPVEVDTETYGYFLEVLPPVFMGRVVPMCDDTTRRVDFGFAEGMAQVMGFWQEQDAEGGYHYFCQLTKLWKRLD